MSSINLRLEKITYEGVEYACLELSSGPLTINTFIDRDPPQVLVEPWARKGPSYMDDFYNVLMMPIGALEAFQKLQKPGRPDGSILVTPSGLYRGDFHSNDFGSLDGSRRQNRIGSSQEIYKELAQLGYSVPPYSIELLDTP